MSRVVVDEERCARRGRDAEGCDDSDFIRAVVTWRWMFGTRASSGREREGNAMDARVKRREAA
jgi:hypothetical protein